MAPAEYNAIKKNFIQIAGVDPEFTNPLLLNKLYFESMSLSSPEVDYYNPFDIINLQFATVKADDNLLPSLYLKDDLAYVLTVRPQSLPCHYGSGRRNWFFQSGRKRNDDICRKNKTND